MRIFVTGSTGMVGRNFVSHSLASEHDLIGPTRAELNLLNFDQVCKYISSVKPDVVVHCAGRVGGIEANIANPIAFLVENFDIGKNVVLAAKQAGVKKLINLGSSCMYPCDAHNPLAEHLLGTGQLEPTNEGYGMAKLAVSNLCKYVTKEFREEGYQFISLIPSNLYGLYDKFDPAVSHLVPAVIHKLHAAKEENAEHVEIWGDGSARREFMFSSDAADAIWFTLGKIDQIPGQINVGLNRDFSVREIYEVAAKVIGYQGRFVYDLTKPIGMRQKFLDSRKIFDLGWKPKISLELGIKKTYQHYLESGIE
jgi:GDP-L-fucose synthase